MTLPRIYQPQIFVLQQTYILDREASHHLLHVLRHKVGEEFILFNGEVGEYLAEIIAIEKKLAVVKVIQFNAVVRESSLNIHLGQGLARGEKMDFIIQKAVELGVTKITPLVTEYSNVKLTEKRLQQRMEHWQRVAIHACAQSGRTQLITIAQVQGYREWITACKEKVKLILDPRGDITWSQLTRNKNLCITVGPEGGFSSNELVLAKEKNFKIVRFGPRLLRTETAGIAAITVAQLLWGDMGGECNDVRSSDSWSKERS